MRLDQIRDQVGERRGRRSIGVRRTLRAARSPLLVEDGVVMLGETESRAVPSSDDGLDAAIAYRWPSSHPTASASTWRAVWSRNLAALLPPRQTERFIGSGPHPGGAPTIIRSGWTVAGLADRA
jgi:hypothetical protein